MLNSAIAVIREMTVIVDGECFCRREVASISPVFEFETRARWRQDDPCDATHFTSSEASGVIVDLTCPDCEECGTDIVAAFKNDIYLSNWEEVAQWVRKDSVCHNPPDDTNVSHSRLSVVWFDSEAFAGLQRSLPISIACSLPEMVEVSSFGFGHRDLYAVEERLA
ncbi:MAG TPA: hypothetical protein PKC05_01715 [Candidatus Saccharibacteria bacterium]|nr:hypothetical protein [Candidatus Saccharibacteria bacterium]